MVKTEDHDLIIWLVESVKYIKEWQDRFHKETNSNIEDLKNNYSWKIEAHETRIFRLESSKIKTTVMLSAWIAIMLVLVWLVTKHMFQ